jgi:hypothetical protein
MKKVLEAIVAKGWMDQCCANLDKVQLPFKGLTSLQNKTCSLFLQYVMDIRFPKVW